MPLFERLGDDDYRVNLPGTTRQLMDGLLEQLATMISDGGPGVRRLFPEPYGDDEERNAGYAVLAGSELADNRLTAIAHMRASLLQERITGTELDAWMRTTNDLRLVMGTILEIEDDFEDVRIDDDKEDLYVAYEHLGFVLESIVAALMPS